MDHKVLGKLLIYLGIIIGIATIVLRNIFFRYSGYGLYSAIALLCAGLIVTGMLMRRTDVEDAIKESSLKINEEFKKAKKKTRSNQEFQDFLDRFEGDEKQVIEYLHTYEGATLKQMKQDLGLDPTVTLQKLVKKKVVTVIGSKHYLSRFSA